MDNLVDRYLEFNATIVTSLVSILVKNSLKDFKLSNKFKDIIYDYLNEVSLSNDILDSNELYNITGLKYEVKTGMMLKLLIDYGVTSRLSLKDKETKDAYLFIVDATMFFIGVLKYVNTDKCGDISFDNILNKTIRETCLNDYEKFRIVLDESRGEVETLFYTYVKNTNNILSILDNNNFKVSISKIDECLNVADISYFNDSLLDFNNKEINYVKRNYEIDIFKNGLILVTLRLIKNLLGNIKKKIFITLPSFIFSKKSFLKILIDCTHIYSVKNNIVLLINYSDFCKNTEIIDSLHNDGYEIAINKDGEIPKNFDLGNAKYLFLNFNNDDEFKRIYKKCNDSYQFVITNIISKSDKLECMNLGIKYFLKK